MSHTSYLEREGHRRSKRGKRGVKRGKRGVNVGKYLKLARKAAKVLGPTERGPAERRHVPEDTHRGATKATKATKAPTRPATPRDKSDQRGAGQETPASFGARPGEAIALAELKARQGSEPSGLSVTEVGAETGRSKSGPALALGNYLKNPNEERLMYLTKDVLTARGLDTAGWKLHTRVVKVAAEHPSNHPLDCGCEECV
jgi:hypothetical protein